MNSSPASSARMLMAAMSSQLHGQRSGARLMVSPPSQFALNTPSLNRLGPNNGLLAREASITTGLQPHWRSLAFTSWLTNGEAALVGGDQPSYEGALGLIAARER